MNRIVTIDELARTVAQFNSCHESDALAFVRETFALAYETLAAGDAVVIKGLGEFRVLKARFCIVLTGSWLMRSMLRLLRSLQWNCLTVWT